MTLTHPAPSETRLSRGVFDDRRRLNRSYLLSLTDEGLLQNFLIEAGIGDQGWHLHPSEDSREARGLDRHWGWETPGSQLRGHFLGHWLSAAAREVAVTGDALLRARIDSVLDGLERCQEENGGGWIWAIPRGYLDRLATGRPIWAPQYAMHKLLMGLVDLHRDLGDERALRMAREATTPLLEWVRGFDDAQFQRILEVETGGMLEVWADLLEATGDPVYSELLERYYRRWLFDGLLEGRDVLTNKHANTTIPEVLGAARAHEVTGEERWRRIVEAYWEQAVTLRGTFCTGGQTSGEIWTPPFEFAARRGEKTQEHCGVYNMIRLADVLLRWTGDLAYADYIELQPLQRDPRPAEPAHRHGRLLPPARGRRTQELGIADRGLLVLPRHPGAGAHPPLRAGLLPRRRHRAGRRPAHRREHPRADRRRRGEGPGRGARQRGLRRTRLERGEAGDLRRPGRRGCASRSRAPRSPSGCGCRSGPSAHRRSRAPTRPRWSTALSSSSTRAA